MSGFDQKTTWVLVSDNVIDGPVVIRIPTADQGQRHGSSCPGGKKAEDWVFASDSHRAGVKRGKQPYWPSTIMRHFIQPVAKKVGIGNISWHTFRHTYRHSCMPTEKTPRWCRNCCGIRRSRSRWMFTRRQSPLPSGKLSRA